MGQGLTGVLTGGPGLEPVCNQGGGGGGGRLRQGILTKVSVLAHLDIKNGMESVEVMIFNDVNLNEVARSDVITSRVDHYADVADRRQEDAAGLNREDATMDLHVDHQDGAEARRRLEALDASGARRLVDRP
ncbi:hypothetical protein PF004_g4044 [Phytophthora fragariae]|uniref:Uncharacterized protein n=2 Tax=Phytophthora fragariae TaxID=53985 RepID=A0A6G0PJL4_9STRA|nr:hypothetical protein PF004_g4044 [Phytophthora fragariae]